MACTLKAKVKIRWVVVFFTLTILVTSILVTNIVPKLTTQLIQGCTTIYTENLLWGSIPNRDRNNVWKKVIIVIGFCCLLMGTDTGYIE